MGGEGDGMETWEAYADVDDEFVEADASRAFSIKFSEKVLGFLIRHMESGVVEPFAEFLKTQAFAPVVVHPPKNSIRSGKKRRSSPSDGRDALRIERRWTDLPKARMPDEPR